MSVSVFLVYCLIWLGIFMAEARFVLRARLSSDWSRVLLMVAFFSAFGPIGEIFVGTLYTSIVGQPLWVYEIWPVHNAYTSLIAPVIWGISGIEFYVLMVALRTYVKNRIYRYALLASGILIIEALINTGHYLIFGQRIFYYTPGDLWHFTSLQTIPFYILASLVAVRVYKIMQSHPIESSILWVGVSLTVVYFS